MAAITKRAIGSGFRRAATAQADTGQTDWVAVPSWARYVTWTISLTAVAGNTPILTPRLLSVDPLILDDDSANTIVLAAMTTPPTQAVVDVINMGPCVTGITDDLALNATGDAMASFNALLPEILGFNIVLDRTTGDETYTYVSHVLFRS